MHIINITILYIIILIIIMIHTADTKIYILFNGKYSKIFIMYICILILTMLNKSVIKKSISGGKIPKSPIAQKSVTTIIRELSNCSYTLRLLRIILKTKLFNNSYIIYLSEFSIIRIIIFFSLKHYSWHSLLRELLLIRETVYDSIISQTILLIYSKYVKQTINIIRIYFIFSDITVTLLILLYCIWINWAFFVFKIVFRNNDGTVCVLHKKERLWYHLYMVYQMYVIG
jgi:hypothetical protein